MIRNGYVVVKALGTASRRGKYAVHAGFKDWFRASANSKYGQIVALRTIYVPKTMFGKKFRLKVEIIEESSSSTTIP